MCKTLCCSLKKVDESSMVRILLVRSSHRKNTFQISHSRSLLNLELWCFQRHFLSDLTGTSVTQTLIHLDPWLLEEYHHHTKSLAIWIGSFSRDLTSDAFWYMNIYDCNLWYMAFKKQSNICTRCAITSHLGCQHLHLREVWGWQCTGHETTLSKAHPTYWSLSALNALWICCFLFLNMAHLNESNAQWISI